MKPGAFAVSFNSVISTEVSLGNYPSTFLLRKVMEEADTYEDALNLLTMQPILVDCLVLLIGMRRGEMAVVERKPNDSRVRYPQNGFIAVTNNYLSPDFVGFDNKIPGISVSALAESTCRRYNTLETLLSLNLPTNMEACFEFLDDPHVRMEKCTMQQAVIHPADGRFLARNKAGQQCNVKFN